MSEFRRFCWGVVCAYIGFMIAEMVGLIDKPTTVADLVAASFYIGALVVVWSERP